MVSTVNLNKLDGSPAEAEYGKVNLFGKSLKQRGKALIQIAHPDHRESLEKAFFERYGSI